MSKTTVVLVHGAFADASSWNGVIERLQSQGVPVTAPANPLRGIAADSAYIASVFDQIDGPVLAVGHSYGGAVITNAATDAKNVVGLVYVAAFAPDEGEALGEVEAGSKDSVLNSALVPRRYPTENGGSANEFYIDPAKARDAFAGDLSDEQAALIAAIQRPVSELAFSEQSGRPAWQDRPAWAVVATGDKAAGDRRRAFDGGTRRRVDHRSRGIARDHGLAAAGRDRRHPPGGRRGRARPVEA
jgi:pimeloyl-ACP methyl ester carboxylesterase